MISDVITGYIKLLDDAVVQHRLCSEELDSLNKKQNDLLHAIEFNEEGYKQRNHFASLLAQCRKDRRFYKDRVEELQPLIDYLSNDANKKAFNMIKQSLGAIRKAEGYHASREYWPRSAHPDLKQFFWQLRNKSNNKST